MPRSVRSARSNSICSVTSESERTAKLDFIASRVKMGKKLEKGLKNEKNQSATSQDDVDSNKALVEPEVFVEVATESDSESVDSDADLCVQLDEPHVCTGNFQNDFNELCRRANMTYVPPIVSRPRPPAPSSQQETSPAKGGKDKGKQAAPEPEPEEVPEDAEPEPKTFTTKDKFEYFKPSIQIEMDHPDKYETITEIFIRGWKIDAPMMEIFKQCWPTMEKLHTVNLWNTGLDSNTLHTLSTFLPQCPNIRNVTLDGNIAPDEENWYELVTEESLIQNLSLRHCGITNKGATMIGRCLGSAKRSNIKLLSLNLSNNKIGDDGLEHIAQGLRMNRTLLSLSLASNQIGDKGTKKLAEVLSKFPLTHEEVVERRRQKLDQPSPDRNTSTPGLKTPILKKRKSIFPLNRRGAESKDRPGSVRSVIHADKGKKADKAPAKAKKDGKKDEKEEKHDKGKGGKKEKEEKGGAKKDHLKVPAHGRAPSPGGRHDHGHHRASSSMGGRGSGASIAADAGKGGKNPKGKGGKDKAKPQAAEHEVSDSPEFINPLLEGGDYKNGTLEVNGNRVLINVNLSRNQITEVGLWAFFEAIEHQTKLALSSNRSSGTGLMRLLVGKNKVASNHDVFQKLNELMLPKDPFYKPPPLTPEVES